MLRGIRCALVAGWGLDVGFLLLYLLLYLFSVACVVTNGDLCFLVP
jgi:hypothetical protein